MLRLIIIGAAGRMGRRVVALTEDMEDVEVVGAVIRPDDPRVTDDAGLVAGTNVLGVPLSGDLPEVEADVVVDFSSPAGISRFVSLCAERRLPLVIGTTGLGAELRGRIVEAARHVPVLVAPNMSIGVALLTRLVAETASSLGIEADVEIVETHHREKKDAPSGTAHYLARAVAEARGQTKDDEITHGGTAQRHLGTPGEIAVHSLRLADVVGGHTVYFGFGSERIELTHRAHSRDVFAHGAIEAAMFVNKVEPGLYSLQDLLLHRMVSS